MKQYEKARNEMKEKNRKTVWELYKKYNYQNIMNIKEVTDLPNVNRSTFYFYYQHTGEILNELIEWLKDEIVTIYSSRKRQDGDFNDFYKEMYEHLNLR